MRYEDFFTYARLRESVRIKKAEGQPWPWCDDPVLRDNYFTNIRREHDKVTEWFRECVRTDLSLSPDVLPATLLFRWFNRIDVGDTIFLKPGDAFNTYLKTGNIEELRAHIKAYHPKGPYVNAAYIIKGLDGMTKLDGVLYAFHRTMQSMDYRDLAETLLMNRSMKWATKRMSEFPQMGMFMAYEVACDLRWTYLLTDAEDILTWANPGPGARRGLNRMSNYPLEYRVHTDECQHMMQEILHRVPEDLGKWEMREVEHTLCEFDKYERVRLGEGRSKRKYSPR